MSKVFFTYHYVNLPFLQSQNSYSHMQSHFQIMSRQYQPDFHQDFPYIIFSNLSLHICYKDDTKLVLTFLFPNICVKKNQF